MKLYKSVESNNNIYIIVFGINNKIYMIHLWKLWDEKAMSTIN